MSVCLGLLVVGVATADKAPVFCYAQLVDRTADAPYPPPSLPKAASPLETEVVRIADGRLEVHAWERRLSDEETAEMEESLQHGRIQIPSDCSVEPGRELSGPILPRSFPTEAQERLPAPGAGVVTSTGFVVADTVDTLIKTISGPLGPAVAARDLGAVLQGIEAATGLGGAFATTSRVGVVERLRRPSSANGLFVTVTPVKPDLRSNAPCRALTLRRSAIAPPRELIVVLSTRSWRSVTGQVAVSLPPSVSETTVDMRAHYTDVDVRVFDRAGGELLEEQHLCLAQSIAFSMSLLGGEDILPGLFQSGAREADLIKRPRVHTSRFTGIDTRGRAPALDALNRSAKVIESLVGAPSWRAESRFFPAGTDSQLEVIRWLKTHIEAPTTAKAFLIDPYLGSQAFERVVLRQGHESVELTLVVSPANVDPDADDLDAPTLTPGGHVDELVRCAERHASRLCGAITLIHVERGGGTRQAFHDRYFGIIQDDGSPRVFLMSNSLSKAAGGWPFAVAEVDAPTAWAIVGYVADITASAGRKATSAKVIWKSKGAKQPVLETDGLEEPLRSPTFEQAIWTAYERVFPIQRGETVDVRAAVGDLMSVAPPDLAPRQLARMIVEGVHDRHQIALAISDALMGQGRGTALSEAIEDELVDGVLATLAPKSGPPPQWLPDEAVLVRIGQRLGRRADGSLRVRDPMNPALHRYTHWLEQDRKGVVVLQALSSALALSLIAMEMAYSAPALDEKFRHGIAIDYLNALGRILRSRAALTLVSSEDGRDIASPAAAVHRLAMRRARDLAGLLPGKVAETYAALKADRLIPADLITPPAAGSRYRPIDAPAAGLH